MAKDEDLFNTFLSALRVAECKNMHEGIVVLKTFIAILMDVEECEDVAVLTAFWVAGLKAVEHICGED